MARSPEEIFEYLVEMHEQDGPLTDDELRDLRNQAQRMSDKELLEDSD